MKPTKPEHFIGKSGLNARILFNQIPKLRQPGLDVDARRYLLLGPPGTGKTSIAKLLSKALTIHPSHIEQINGQSCTIEKVRQWRESACYVPFDTIVQLVDEIDAASPAACNELRTYLDELGARTVFIATTNKGLDQLQEQLQSRFKVYYFDAIKTDELSGWLRQVYGLDAECSDRVAAGSRGNVRAALLTTLSIIEAREALAQ